MCAETWTRSCAVCTEFDPIDPTCHEEPGEGPVGGPPALRMEASARPAHQAKLPAYTSGTSPTRLQRGTRSAAASLPRHHLELPRDGNGGAARIAGSK